MEDEPITIDATTIQSIYEFLIMYNMFVNG